jgi:hypothetical protein
MSSELLIIELRRIATALERIADNGELREWSLTALNTLEHGIALMKLEQLSEWEGVRSVIESYPEN